METITLSAEDLQFNEKADMEAAIQSLIGAISNMGLSLEDYRTERLKRMESGCGRDDLV